MSLQKVRVYQWQGRPVRNGRIPNVGDTLSAPILEHFLKRPIEIVTMGREHNKLLAVGSVLWAARPGDVIWGTGSLTNRIYNLKGITVLAVRGKFTRKAIKLTPVPEIYGDPALLLPLIYKPQIEKTNEWGIIPHYVDRHRIFERHKQGKLIETHLPWRQFIDEILSCEKIISSSLHGIIIAEAYGIPATWALWSRDIMKQTFKFQDYMTGTGRTPQPPFTEFAPIPNLEEIQNRLIKALLDYYGNPQNDTPDMDRLKAETEQMDANLEGEASQLGISVMG